MFKKALLIASVVALVFVIGAATVSAGDDDTDGCFFYNADLDLTVPGYCDGRINAFDIAQSVAVYYRYDTIQAVDDDGSTYLTDAVTGIELWAIDSQSAGHLVLWVPIEDINLALEADSHVQIAASGGYTLNYSPAGDTFWVTAPDGYTFAWEAW